MRTSQKKDADIANCEMVFGGQKLQQALVSLVSSVSVDLAIGKPGMFTLEMEGYGAKQDFKWMEDNVFALGTKVEVKMGYRAQRTSVFFGEVIGVDASFSPSEPPRMTLRSYDLMHRLTRGEKRRVFTNLKYSDIVRTIASEAELSPRVTSSAEVYEYVEQKGERDLAFLLRLAQEIDYDLFVVGKEMVFEPVSNDSSASMKLSLDDELTDFHPNLSLAGKVSEVVVRGWDAAKNAEIVGRARAGAEGSTMGGKKSASNLIKETFGNSDIVRTISDHPVKTQSEADTLARARLNEMSLDLIEATGTSIGRPDLLPGKVIEISGVSKWFSGRYYLTNTTHRYDYKGGYTTTFSARRNGL
jgi:phage protein D